MVKNVAVRTDFLYMGGGGGDIQIRSNKECYKIGGSTQIYLIWDWFELWHCVVILLQVSLNILNLCSIFNFLI